VAILVVEDDDDLLEVLCYTIRRAGYDVLKASNGATALQFADSKSPDLLLLDLNLPDMKGWDIVQAVREKSTTPIIILTGNDRESDVVRGLEIGADDFVKKPFSPAELLGRIRAVLRRTAGGTGEKRYGWEVVSAGDLRLDPQYRSVLRDTDSIVLTPTEFKLLYELVIHEGQVLTYAALTNRVWGYDGVANASMLKGHIRNLRSKLSDDASKPLYVHTVPGVGYTFRSVPTPT
jgi:DNA-binding response OmpR family regulator